MSKKLTEKRIKEIVKEEIKSNSFTRIISIVALFMSVCSLILDFRKEISGPRLSIYHSDTNVNWISENINQVSGKRRILLNTFFINKGKPTTLIYAIPEFRLDVFELQEIDKEKFLENCKIFKNAFLEGKDSERKVSLKKAKKVNYLYSIEHTLNLDFPQITDYKITSYIIPPEDLLIRSSFIKPNEEIIRSSTLDEESFTENDYFKKDFLFVEGFCHVVIELEPFVFHTKELENESTYDTKQNIKPIISNVFQMKEENINKTTLSKNEIHHMLDLGVIVFSDQKDYEFEKMERIFIIRTILNIKFIDEQQNEYNSESIFYSFGFICTNNIYLETSKNYNLQLSTGLAFS